MYAAGVAKHSKASDYNVSVCGEGNVDVQSFLTRAREEWRDRTGDYMGQIF